MPENILVVEYEPRYTDRVRQALAGQPFTASFARDGDEALRALEGEQPRLIVLSSVIPKVSTAELIRNIRGRDALQQTPILLTVSGYNGKSPRQDAARLGASDILPKPYSETEFLGKVQQMLGIRAEPFSLADFTVRPANVAAAEGQLTSNEIFGDLLSEERAPSSPAARRPMNPKDNVDKLLADTLAGVMKKKKEPTAAGTTPVPPPASGSAPEPAPPASPKPKTHSGTSEFDRVLQNTLSGLEKSARRTSAGTVAVPHVAPPSPKPAPEKAGAVSEKMPIASPIFPQAAPAAAPLEDEEPTDGIKFGQYVLLEKIATGGMAEVWKARMRGVEGFQKIVAIKKILPHLSDDQDFIEMFVDEAKLAAQLNHNNIIHIYDLGKIQNSYYIAMEYIDGSDLKAILKKAQERDLPMSIDLALFIASKIAAALDYAHRKRDFSDREMGLVHRDVSPQNVLISEEGDIKLCDFGIAKAASKASHTQAGALKGKLQYMSPEQAWGRTIDKRSDIFPLATVLFEMLTGRKLFTGDNEMSIIEQVREAKVAPPSQFNDEVTPQIDNIVRKALQKDPATRYQTAGEMQRDIDAVLYTFKPTPTSADLAIYMHRLASAEPVMARAPETAPEPEPLAPNELRPASAPGPAVAAALAHTLPNVSMPAWDAPPSPVAHGEPARKKPVAAIPIAIVAVIVIAAVGAYLVLRNRPAAPAPKRAAVTASTATQPPAPAAATPTIPTATTDTLAAAAAAAPTATSATVDTSKVDEEVRKRIAAEKARLDQLARAQTATQAPPPVQRPTPQPQPQPVVTQTVAPPPAPVVPAPQPEVPAPQPAPVPVAEPVVVRAQTGDLVEPGTPGLIPARMTRQALAMYPQIARMQRIQGAVTISALVSETGQVTDTRIVSTANPILNEAALQSVRRSTFLPGTKDGARVKSWTAVRVEFKL